MQDTTTEYGYLQATGKLEYNMTNDYMFRMVLQRDEETLIGLICSILKLQRESVLSVRIENAIDLGADVTSKEYQLDIHVTLNNDSYINLEMQVVNYKNWPERSLSYLCRRFDNVSKGKDYITVKPVYHVGFLDFTLFEDHPEFFGQYQMRNSKDKYLYTDKFNLFVVDLNHTELATDEDRASGIDTWAKLFKATTWEEIKMITKDNPSMNSTAESIYLSNSDFEIRERCRVREDAIIHEKLVAEKLEAQAETIATQAEEINRLKKLLADNGIQE
ncbi:Rpn family recombination-promoting nuclease/putative transposase [Butyrivibrio fibrisolvens]|uniref:Rpn family recombination-promoting nuclease/putative transposase n=1 Tax=Butyrivibrio fibrisolvens TaxID=831 RepID=UPI0003FD5C3F|nr:Rpn family recombination-promoting nuclease/putative transposase [Butyrivibrio fibrisolvens]